MHYIVKSANKYGMTRYLVNTPAPIRTARRARWMIKSAPRGEKTKHREKKASGADARRDVTRRPLLFRHLLNARDCSATFFRRSCVRVCSRPLRLRDCNRCAPVHQRPRRRELTDGSPSKRAPLRETQREIDRQIDLYLPSRQNENTKILCNT